MSRAYVSPWRLGSMAAVILLCFAAVVGRLFVLHVVEAGQLAETAEHNRQSFDVLYARRGDVVDDRGKVLATTRSVIELGVDPSATDPADLAKLPALAQMIGVPLANLQTAFATKVRPGDGTDAAQEEVVRWTPLQENLDESVYAQVQKLGIKGVYGNDKFQRVYPGGQLAAHVLGYLDKDSKPAAGVENTMDFYLRGQDGWRETEHDGHRHELAQFDERDVAPTDGLNVELTIDTMLQYYAEQAVDNLVSQYHPQGVSIIMSDPATGEILAMANYPTYDPNNYGSYPLVNLNNRAVSDVFQPGSTFKIVTAAAALNEGLVTPDDRFDCSVPTIVYNGRTLKLAKDDVPNGVLTVSQIVARSSNRGAANIGCLLGEQRLYNYAWDFGFGQKTDVPLAGESRGDLHPVSNWDGLMITRVPMGYAVAATALQVHQAMSVIANHGVLMAPILVRRVYDNNHQTVVAFSPEPLRRVISTRTADMMNEMLCAVVGPDGTASRAKLKDITVAGKTGTTQKIIDGHYSTEHHVATFTGYLPAERPRLVITVVVDDAQMEGTAFGGLVSAPAFHDIAEEAVQYLGIQPVSAQGNLVAMKGDNLDWFR